MQARRARTRHEPLARPAKPGEARRYSEAGVASKRRATSEGRRASNGVAFAEQQHRRVIRNSSLDCGDASGRRQSRRSIEQPKAEQATRVGSRARADANFGSRFEEPETSSWGGTHELDSQTTEAAAVRGTASSVSSRNCEETAWQSDGKKARTSQQRSHALRVRPTDRQDEPTRVRNLVGGTDFGLVQPAQHEETSF